MKKIIKNFFNDFESITKYYNYLVSKTKNHEYVEITNEWLIDNYYLLVEHKNNLLTMKYDLTSNYKVISSNYLFLKNISQKNVLSEELKKLSEVGEKIISLNAEKEKLEERKTQILDLQKVRGVKMQIVYKKTDELVPYENNPRKK